MLSEEKIYFLSIHKTLDAFSSYEHKMTVIEENFSDDKKT
jgi:hypothetical protein